MSDTLALVVRAVQESGLLKACVEAERGRTMAQMGLFASVVRLGKAIDARIKPATLDCASLPRADHVAKKFY